MVFALDTRMEGFDKAEQRLRIISERADDLRPAWVAVGRWYGSRGRQKFVEGRSKWAPLRQSYVQRKRRLGGAGKGIGVLSGSLRLHATEDTPDVAEKTYALFGVTRADPATVQRRAGYLKKGRRSMRSRNVVPALRATERRQVGEIITDELLKEP